ncbi:serine hydrolase domain-containing protein [Bryobacter aggregatus]|uniref:serine hydrolase domain-containing protein n=1 Tax=Bryobacter aggregatus TaxID=360054 RepID=UPI00138E4056|nr:serine hydrolase domain-containing protein [Bryobacter aggregatus]
MLETEQVKDKIPGYAAAAYYKGEIVWGSVGGFADLKAKRPVKRDTPFRLASISKSISAVAMLELYEAKKLALSDDVRKYCPAFPPKDYPITLAQLLGHIGGIRHYNTADPSDMDNRVHYNSVTDSLRKFAGDPLASEPGTKYIYTTYGYSLVGCAIEGASGMPYEKWIEEHILLPTGMKNTAPDNGKGISSRRCLGYRKVAKGKIEDCALSDNSAKIPGGGLVSTVDDLLLFVDGILKHHLLKPETIDLMWTSGRLKTGKLTGYGLGWSLSRSPEGDREIYHTGGQQGASTILYLRPDQNFAFVWLANLEALDNRLPVSRNAYKIVSGK